MRYSWWRHQMQTFSALLAIFAGNSPVTGEFPAQRPVTRSFDVFFDLRPKKRLNKQSLGWWFETPSGSLWRHWRLLWFVFTVWAIFNYHQISNIKRIKYRKASPCSCLCPIHWIQMLSREWRCSGSSAGRRCSNYIWMITNSIAN